MTASRRKDGNVSHRGALGGNHGLMDSITQRCADYRVDIWLDLAEVLAVAGRPDEPAAAVREPVALWERKGTLWEPRGRTRSWKLRRLDRDRSAETG